MLHEEQAEIMALTDLATNLSDGMTMLSPSNIARPVKTFAKPSVCAKKTGRCLPRGVSRLNVRLE